MAEEKPSAQTVEEQITPVRDFLTRRLAKLTPREVAQRGIRASVVEGRYRGGLITDPVFLEELIRLGYSREEATHRLTAARLDFDSTLRLELLNAYRDAYRAERISAPALHEFLAELGVRAELREALVGHELLRRKVEPPPPEETALRAIGSSTVIRRFREGLTDGPSFAEEMYSLGYEPTEVVRYRVLAELELDAALRLEQVAAYRDGFRAGRLDEHQFRAALLSIGIDRWVTEIYLDHERLRIKVDAPPPEEEALKATGSGVVIRRYREGWTTLQQFTEEMRSLGYTDQEIERYAIVATLEFDYDYRDDALAYLRDAYHRREISADAFLASLETLAMDRNRALLHLSREQLRLVPVKVPPKPPPPLPAYQTATGKARVQEALTLFRDERITVPELRSRLSIQEMPADLVEATVDLEIARIEVPEIPPPKEPLPFYETDEGKLWVAQVREAFRRDLITSYDLLFRLKTLGMPEGQAVAFVTYEETRKVTPPAE